MSEKAETTASGTPTPFTRYEKFLETVREACGTPVGRATLQQGLADLAEAVTAGSQGSTWRLYTVLLPHGPIPAWRQERDAEYPFLLIACLYALHDAPNPRTTTARRRKPPATDGRCNLGWSYARATAMKIQTAPRARDELLALATLDLDGLYQQLPGAIARLRSRAVPVAWPVLLRDLVRWGRFADDVRIDWFRSLTAPAPVHTDSTTTKENNR